MAASRWKRDLPITDRKPLSISWRTAVSMRGSLLPSLGHDDQPHHRWEFENALFDRAGQPPASHPADRRTQGLLMGQAP